MSNKKDAVEVEVVKGDKVIYENGDFEDFNAEQNLESNTDDSKKEDSKKEDSKENDSEENDSEEDESKEDDSKEDDSEEDDSESDKQESSKDLYSAAISNIYQWAAKLKEEFIPEKDKKSESNQDSDSEEGTESDKKSDSKKEEGAEEDKHSVSIANIYQWAAKLKEDFASEASSMTHDVSEKALGIMLTKPLNAAETELKAFDKKVEDSEEPIDNAEEERNKINAKKEKYQGMIDLLQGE